MKITYNKLVRDGMLAIYEADVAQARTATGYAVRHLTSAETLIYLKDKLQEEVAEAYAVYDPHQGDELKEELGDVIEVIAGIAFHSGFLLTDVLAVRDAKRDRKGGFETGLYLESIDYIEGKEPK